MEKRKEPILVTRSSMPPFEEFTEMIKPIWETAWLTNMGVYHERLKEELKEYLKTPEIELFVNGHMALEMTLQAFDLTGEVITTPYSFASTTHAIVRNGLTPVFCDIDPEDYTIDIEKLEGLITPETTAIVPVHVYGTLCNVDAIEEIARKHGLKVIYDAAHAFGVESGGRSAASFGDASMFSFHATKVFNSIEGGAVTFRDPALKDLLYQIKNFGITGKESVEYVGGNGKMNEFQAAMGLCNLKYADREIEKRKKLVNRYYEHLSGVKGIRLLKEKKGQKSNYAYMPVVFDGFYKDRDQIYQELADYNIYARKYFYPCINQYQCYSSRFGSQKTPVAEQISKQVLTLPLYADLPEDVVDQVCRIILEGGR